MSGARAGNDCWLDQSASASQTTRQIVWCLRVLRVQDNDQLGGRCLNCPGGWSNIQIPKTPPSTRRSRPCSRTSLQLTSKRHRAPQLGYLGYLGRQLLTPLATHWVELACRGEKKDGYGMRGWVSAAELAACDEG